MTTDYTKMATDKDKRIGWLRDLKVGDKVYVNEYGVNHIREVERITPTGRLTVNGLVYNPHGREGGSTSYTHSRLSEWTPEREADIEENKRRQVLISHIGRLSLRQLSTKALEQIVFLVEMDAENTAALERVTNS